MYILLNVLFLVKVFLFHGNSFNRLIYRRFTLAVKMKICLVKIFCLPQISVTDNLVDRRTHSPTILGDNGKISGLAAALDEGGCRH